MYGEMCDSRGAVGWPPHPTRGAGRRWGVGGWSHSIGVWISQEAGALGRKALTGAAGGDTGRAAALRRAGGAPPPPSGRGGSGAGRRRARAAEPCLHSAARCTLPGSGGLPLAEEGGGPAPGWAGCALPGAWGRRQSPSPPPPRPPPAGRGPGA